MAIRVYEYSKLSGVANKELLQLLRDNGFEVGSHMSLLTDEALAFLQATFEPKSTAPAPQQVAPSEVKRQAEPAVAPVKEGVVAPEEDELQGDEVISGGPVVERRSMTVAELAENLKVPVTEVIMALLKKRVVAAKNQIVSEDVVAATVREFGGSVVEPVSATRRSLQEAEGASLKQSVSSDKGQRERLPIIVVVGHVDHGKTTLLDHIRKTRVAAREKGGITQHLGAYEAHTAHGSLVFLDTPGHEAFSLMRIRGIRAADIAILVVAADDGVMPQTIEAIKAVQAINIPIVVALNKMDKATPVQLEKVKQNLSHYGLVPEEWGGQTIMVPVSAKFGQGIDSLLEILVLQAQMMELTANPELAAVGYILESKVEKGLGVVATVICQQGTLRIGDLFVAGSVVGKVTALINSNGARLKEVGPSVPVLVVGFEALPEAGDRFEVVPVERYKQVRSRPSTAATAKLRPTAAAQESALQLIVKADNASSREALLGSIQKLSGKAFQQLAVLHSGLGAVTESDVVLAADTGALIYGLHVKVEPNAATLAQREGVKIKQFDIIYKLLEDLEVVAEEGRPVRMVTKKTGEAVVLKVFDIKGLGVIAGAQVKTGICSRQSKLVIWRGKQKVGEGPIKSLQRDKKSVKEVHAGFECAFLVDGFSEWQVDDRIECYLEVRED